MSRRDRADGPDRSNPHHRHRRAALPRSLRLRILAYGVQQPWRSSSFYRMTLPSRRTGAVRSPAVDPWPGDATRGNAIVDGQFQIGGVILSEKDLWLPPTLSPTAMADLHGFAWLRDLRAAGGERTRRKARHLMHDWIKRFPGPHAVAWHPAILGRRLNHCLSLYDVHGASADALYRADFIESAIRQATFLMRILPGPLFGLDLIAAATGLLVAGAALPDSEEWYAQALRLVEQALAQQILPDGMHVERSPARQLHLLRHLVDIRSIVTQRGEPIPTFLSGAIESIAPALRLFLLGDGTLARFNDTPDLDPWLIELILTRANGGQHALLQAPMGGFQRLAAGRTLVIADTGAPSPIPYEQNAHAGIGAFEFSSGRDRIVVNCGAHPTDRQWRQAQRFSAAHSTLIAADLNNAVLLNDSGMVPPLPRVMCRREDDANGQNIYIQHDGYQARLGVVHERRIGLSADGVHVSGTDLLTGTRDVTYVIRFHLHPDIHATLSQDSKGALLRSASGQGWRFRGSGGTVTLSDSVYLGRHGQVRRSQQIVMAGVSGDEPAQWRFSRESPRR